MVAVGCIWQDTQEKKINSEFISLQAEMLGNRKSSQIQLPIE